MKVNLPELLHSFKLGVCIVGPDFKIIFINHAALEIFNLAGRNVVGANYSQLIFPFIDDKFKDLNKLPLTLAVKNSRKYNYVLRVQSREKTAKSVNCMVMPVYNAENHIRGGIEIYATEDAFPALFGAADYQRVANMFVSKIARNHIATSSRVSHNAVTALKRYRTLVFVDIVGFTTMSESFDPHDVIEILNAFYDRVNSTVNLYHGDIDKFIGDAMLVVFENAEAAVRFGTDLILKDLPIVNNQLTKRFKRLSPLKVHVGINTGWIILGEMGARDRKDFTVIGDNVNIAARIQGLTPPNEVWISGKTFANVGAVQKLFEATESMKLKGKQQALSIYKFVPEKLDMSKKVLLFEKGKELQTNMKLKLQRMGVKEIVVVENNEELEREANISYESMIVGSSVQLKEVSSIQKILAQAGKNPNAVIKVSADVSPASVAALEKLGIKTMVAYGDDDNFESTLASAMRAEQVGDIEQLKQNDEEVHRDELQAEKKKIEDLQPVRDGFVIFPAGKNYEVEISKTLLDENILALQEDIRRMWIYKSNRSKEITFTFKFDKLPADQLTKPFLDKLFTELLDDDEMQFDSWKIQPLKIAPHNDELKQLVESLEKLFEKNFL